MGVPQHAEMQTYDEIALGVESAWPVFVLAGLQAVAATPSETEEPAFPSIPTTA
jgi:hypothetical protein